LVVAADPDAFVYPAVKHQSATQSWWSEHWWLLLLALALMVSLERTDWLWRLDAVIYDWQIREYQRSPSSEIALIAIDDQSLKQLGRWPWPRHLHADLLERLRTAGAKVVGFDILFTEPDLQNPLSDRALAEAVAAHGRVVFPISYEATESRALREVLPLPALAKAAAKLGHIDAELDPDAVARAVFLKAGIENPTWPAFALAILQLVEGDSSFVLPGERSPYGPAQTGALWRRDYRVLIPFVGPPGRFQPISFADVLNGTIDDERFRDKLVLIGMTATNLGDALPTPVSGQHRPMSGLEFNANLLDALRNNIVITPVPAGWRLLLLTALVMMTVLLYSRALASATLLVAITGWLLTLGISVLLMQGNHLWLAPTPALVAIMISYPVWSFRRLERAVRDLFTEKERAQVTLHAIADGVVTTDVHGRIEYLNPTAEQWSGLMAAQARGQLWHDVFRIVYEHDESQIDPVSRCLVSKNTVQLPDEALMVTRCGKRYAVRGYVSSLCDERGNPYGVVMTLSDVTSARHLENKMAHQATHDELTELPNRSLLLDRLQQAIANARRIGHEVAVLFIDLDRFKTINDSLGHAVGDALLQSVAARITASVREGDTVARLGGDEFVVVLQNFHHTDAVGRVAGKISELSPPPFLLDGREVFVTCSVGISLFPKDGEDAETLLKHADAAMYQAKDQGRDNFQFFTQALNRESIERLTMEKHLRYAIQRDELKIVYQPKVSLATGRIDGVEALLRWEHPELGQVPPVQFIPVAEDTGLIIPIGEWVLRTACAQAKTWQKEGLPPIRVAVNLSVRQFLQKDLIQTVRTILDETGLQASFLEFEITESLIMKDMARVGKTLLQFKEMGGSVSIDDFGTGYSSLTYLKRFPVDHLKIDQSFVRDVISDPDDAAITAAVIAMARGLQIQATAEGVETEQQVLFLQSRQCDQIQGYYFSKPLNAAEMSGLLRTNRNIPVAMPKPTGGSPALLLVDDDESVLNLCVSLLRDEGFRVFTASTPSEALAIMAQHEIAVIVSDEVMPEMSGTELLARVRKLYPRTVRVLFSSLSDPEFLVKAINEGAIFKFLSKPVSEATLREPLREAFALYRGSGKQ
jgi:diguanylate cyclase (GGDEF)-like protein/PAS domain S-box-containing protein